MLAGHWLPWRQLIGRSLPKLAAYSWGVGGILAGFALVAPRPYTLLLLVVAVCAGGATVAGMLTDSYIANKREVIQAKGTLHVAESTVPQPE